MKRVLSWILVVGLLAGHVFASPLSFTLNRDAAMILTDIRHRTDGTYDYSLLYDWTPTTDEGIYGTSMRGVVGFSGELGGASATYAAMLIGAAGSAADDVVRVALADPSHATGLLGYDEYNLFVANDNNSNWSFRLYLETAGTNKYWGAMTELGAGQDAILSLDLTHATHLDNVTGIGFEIEGWLKGGPSNPQYPSDPDVFHVSVVPVPGAFALTLFGLGFGVRLRGYVRQNPCRGNHRVD